MSNKEPGYVYLQNSFLTNKDRLLSDVINGILPKSNSLDVLVGYFYFSGYKLISEKLIEFGYLKAHGGNKNRTYGII